jgi:hypothetical protein
VHRFGVSHKPVYKDGAWTHTWINNYWCIGVGKDAIKWGGKETEHLTITKDGNITVYFDKFEPICE